VKGKKYRQKLKKGFWKYQTHGGHHESLRSNYFAGPVKLLNINNDIIK
jgi:hypothetical protein